MCLEYPFSQNFSMWNAAAVTEIGYEQVNCTSETQRLFSRCDRANSAT